jgi:hypothetical protein
MSLRDDVTNYWQQRQCNGQLKKRLLIQVPVAVAQSFTPTDLDIFDATLYTNTDSASYIYLRLFPEYDTENDQLGEGGFKNTFSRAAVFAPSTTRRGFKATINDNRKIIFDLVRRLVEISESSAYNTYSPIRVIDFCSPELSFDNNTFIFNGETATVRWGLLNIDNFPSLLDNKHLNKSWTISFKETRLRLV